MNRGKILIVPACEEGQGGGHLTRCIKLARDLRLSGWEALLLITPQKRNLTHLYASLDFNPAYCITNEEVDIRTEKLNESFNFIILDRFQTPQDEFARWKKTSPVIGIDEGGSCRGSFDFLIDILVPENFIFPKANITSPALLFNSNLTENKNIQNGFPLKSGAMEEKEFVKILVSFGQEDKGNLGIKASRALCGIKNSCFLDITLLKGALTSGSHQKLPENVTVLEYIPNLSEHLNEYDTVITHYGITSFEAVFSDVPVFLDHPSKYHKKLAERAGFSDIKFLIKIIKQAADKNDAVKKIEKLQTKKIKDLQLKKINESLKDICGGFKLSVNRKCPVCGGETPENSTARFRDRTYRRCKKCSIIYMDRNCPPPIEYGRDYFFDSYLKQYGKTYLEDFPNLILMSKRRLKIIKSLAFKSENLTLLDIGCAYGPFLAAAKNEGFSPSGIEPALDAVNYVKKELGIHAVHGFFPPHQEAFSVHSFDIITLWFVIEHFKDCISVFSEIKKIIKPKGILAFSTPSSSGISSLFSVRKFLEKSPSDHFTVWSPGMCKKALALSGFKIKKIVICGHHPERFPLLGKLAKNKKSPVYWLLLFASNVFKLGDTFEVYAQKMD